MIAEATAEGILLRPAMALPVEVYTPERRAEFLLSNAVDEADYAWAVREVRAMGLDPEAVAHVGESPKPRRPARPRAGGASRRGR